MATGRTQQAILSAEGHFRILPATPPPPPLFLFFPSAPFRTSFSGRREVALGPSYESVCRQERGLARRAPSPARLPPPHTRRPTQGTRPSHRRSDATPQPSALAHLLRDSFVQARPVIAISGHRSSLALPPPLGGHDVAEAQPALILVYGMPLAVHILVQQTADELRASGVADEAQYEVMHEPGVVWRGAKEQFARHVHEVLSSLS